MAVLLLAACGNDPAGGNVDAPSGSHVVDAPMGTADASPDGARPDAMVPDAPIPDATLIDAAAIDAAMIDAAIPDAAVPDAGFASAQHVHILIDNFCNTSADPQSFDVPRGSTLQLTWHNHSVDYEADVWLSYGGGYLGLAQGGTWSDPFTFCASAARPYDAAGDVSIAGGPSSACPGFRVLIHCL